MKTLCIYLLILSLSISSSASAQEGYQVSLREKIGQMLLIGFEGKRVNADSPIVKTIEKNNIGGVILFDYNARTKTFNKNIESPEQVRQLNHKLQYYTKLGNLKHHRPLIPLFISTDYEGGKVNRLSERYGFPKTLSAAEVGQKKTKEVESIAEAMTSTLKNSGFNLNFAPILDMDINPNNPIIGTEQRSFSNKSTQVVRYATIYSQQFSKQNIECVYKHFPGHGSSTQDSHLGFVDVTHTWTTEELKPYEQLIPLKDSCKIIMSAHIINKKLDDSGLPATLSHKILTDLLRQKLKFKGIIVTDDMQMQAISKNYSLEKALVLSINAGADMLIFGNNLTVPPQNAEQIINIIESKVRSGDISTKRIDEAYQRIISLKRNLT